MACGRNICPNKKVNTLELQQPVHIGALPVFLRTIATQANTVEAQKYR